MMQRWRETEMNADRDDMDYQQIYSAEINKFQSLHVGSDRPVADN
jgi:hypothetical protein